MPVQNQAPESFQKQFHRRWNCLHDPHVRALAWLLYAPNLLDPQAPQWRNLIASITDLPCTSDAAIADWLIALDRHPAPLHEMLGAQPFNRLGRYAEKLMAMFFAHQDILVGHGVQVQAGKTATVGEFDFLLRDGEALLHWEFATKFYLLESNGTGCNADYFVGPNLADSLGAKMHKILDQQLALAQHPAALAYLPQRVSTAQALIKGWLFYPDLDQEVLAGLAQKLGLAQSHCRGFWCTSEELHAQSALAGERYVILPRLQWLAPAKVALGQTLNRLALQQSVMAHFQHDSMPLLIAILEQDGEHALETRRGFVVPDDWRDKAKIRLEKSPHR